MTYRELMSNLLRKGRKHADIEVLELMKKFKEKTGQYPMPNAPIPEWLLKEFNDERS